MRHAIAEARRLGHRAILLVGDAPYYGRFGFSAEKTGSLAMPGPYERHRLLALELEEGALDGACGVIAAAGRKLKPRRLVGPQVSGKSSRCDIEAVFSERRGRLSYSTWLSAIATDMSPSTLILPVMKADGRVELAGDQMPRDRRATA